MPMSRLFRPEPASVGPKATDTPESGKSAVLASERVGAVCPNREKHLQQQLVRNATVVAVTSTAILTPNLAEFARPERENRRRTPILD